MPTGSGQRGPDHPAGGTAGGQSGGSGGGGELWRLSGLGMEFVSAIAAGGLIGWLFDRWLGTKPTGVLIGLLVGILGGGWVLIRQALEANRREVERMKSRGKEDNRDAD